MTKTKEAKQDEYNNCPRCKGTGYDPEDEDPFYPYPYPDECRECRQRQYDEIDNYKMMTLGY